MQPQKTLSIIAIIIAILGVVVPIGYDYFTSRLLIQIQVLSSTQLAYRLDSDIEVTYKGKVVESVSKVEFLVINNGNKPITNEQVKVSPRVSFGDTSKLLEVEITKSEPSSIISNISHTENYFSINFPLLNPGDQIFITTLVSGKDLQINAGGRIYGIKDIEIWDRRYEKVNPRELSSFFFVPLIGAFLALFVSMLAIREYRLAKAVINSWGEYSQINIKEFKSNIKSSLSSPLYGSEKAAEEITPLLKELGSEDNIIDEKLYYDIKGVIVKTANKAIKANLILFIVTSTVVTIALYYSIITLFKVYG